MYCNAGTISFKVISTYAKFKSGDLKPGYYFALNNALVLINNQLIKNMEPFIGQIQAFGFNFAPQNWAFCDGSLLPISEYDTLFALIGTTYGGDGQDTFALPDLRGRIIVHPGSGPGLSTIVQGQTGGVESVTLTPNNLPAHNHPVSVAVYSGNGEVSASTNYIANHDNAFSEAPAMGAVLNGVTMGPAGGGQAFSNRDPYLGINYCIALYGIFPTPS